MCGRALPRGTRGRDSGAVRKIEEQRRKRYTSRQGEEQAAESGACCAHRSSAKPRLFESPSSDKSRVSRAMAAAARRISFPLLEEDAPALGPNETVARAAPLGTLELLAYARASFPTALRLPGTGGSGELPFPYVWNAGVQARDVAGSECCANGYEDSELICTFRCLTAGRAIVLGPLHETSVYPRLQTFASARACVGGLKGKSWPLRVTVTRVRHGHDQRCRGQTKNSNLDSGRSQVSNVL